jgi:hypothetical protein
MSRLVKLPAVPGTTDKFFFIKRTGGNGSGPTFQANVLGFSILV